MWVWVRGRWKLKGQPLELSTSLQPYISLSLSLPLTVLEKRMPGAWTPSIDFCIVKARSQQQQCTGS